MRREWVDGVITKKKAQPVVACSFDTITKTLKKRGLLHLSVSVLLK